MIITSVGPQVKDHLPTCRHPTTLVKRGSAYYRKRQPPQEKAREKKKKRRKKKHRWSYSQNHSDREPFPYSHQ